MNGVVLIDKPSGCTSHDVVNRWRRLAGTKRVGHLGTLDPMATGLLALVTGSATRLAQFFGKDEKTYEAEITFGQVSDTYDAEGEIVETGEPSPSESVVRQALEYFRGRFQQTPPPVSAKKIKGVPAYKLARKKLEVKLEPVDVEVKNLEVLRFEGNRLEIVATCSTGTYIRSLAHDLGQRIGCGALLSRLRRTAIGDFKVNQAKNLDELTTLAQDRQLTTAVIPAGELLPDMPAERFDETAEAQIRQGRDFRVSPFVVPAGTQRVRALSHSGELIAIGELVIPNLYHPATVLAVEAETSGTTKA